MNRLLFHSLQASALAFGTLIACDRRLTVQYYTETSEKVTGHIRFALLADLHNTLYGKNQRMLTDTLRTLNPNAVFLTGDISDGQMNYRNAQLLFFSVGKQFPCYYVSGNHEFWAANASVIKKMASSCGITVLEGENRLLTAGSQKINICGVDDPARFKQGRYWGPELLDGWKKQLAGCESSLDGACYSILLSHRPELTEYYTHSRQKNKKGFDLVLTGHAHGGQVRIPGLVNGLFAPNQGFFPRYAGGRYRLGDTVMIVSRGLCKNTLPRIFNRPELVVIDVLPAALPSPGQYP